MAPRVPSRDAVERLIDWRPPHGVISVYLEIDPADRSEGWRVELRDHLREIADAARSEGGERRTATAETVERIIARFDEPHPTGRLQLGFCEVAARGGRDEWLAVQMRRQGTEIVHRDAPHLAPLVELLDEGAPVGVAAVSAERVRLLEWSFGFLDEVRQLEAAFFQPSWRERKAQVTRDPVRVQGPSASGRDQYDQRLEANRHRFLEQAGRLVGEEAQRRRWRGVLAFGDASQVDHVAEGSGERAHLRHASESVVVSEDRSSLADRVNEAVATLNRDREVSLVERARSAALSSEGRGALGLRDTRRALEEGRVQHLLFDGESADDGLSGIADELIEAALRTSAGVTPVEGQAAESLREHGGVAALLRY